MANKTAKRQAQGIYDLIMVIIATFVCAMFFILFDVFETFHEMTRKWQYWEIDQILLPLSVLTVCLIWFSYRRWKESLSHITERKLGEEKLRHTEVLLQTIMDESNLVIFFKKAEDLSHAWINKEFEEVTGISNSDLPVS